MPRTLSDDVAAAIAEPTGTRPILVVSVYWSVDEPTHYAAEALTDPVTAAPKLGAIRDVTDRTGFEQTAESTEWAFDLIDADLAIRDLIAAASAIGPLGRRVLFRLTFPGVLWDDATTLFDGFIDKADFDAIQRIWRLEAVGWDKALDAEFLPTVSKRSFPKLPIDDTRASRAVLPLVIGDPVYRVPAVLIARPGFGRLGTELRLWHQNLYLHADAGDLGFPLDGEVSLAVGWPGNYEIVTGGFVGSEDDDTEAEDFEPRKRFVIRSRTRVWASGTALRAGALSASSPTLRFIGLPVADLPSSAAADVIGRVIYYRDDYQFRTTGSGAIVWRSMVATMASVGTGYVLVGYNSDRLQLHHAYDYFVADPQGLDVIWPPGTPVTQVHPGTLTNPFETLDGETAITVNWASHGLEAGDIVRFASSQDVGGLRITGVFAVTSVNSIDQFVITADDPATSDASGGGTVNYWTRPEAGNNNYWKYCIAAHPVTSVERLEARGQIAPPGGGAAQPIWFTLSDAEYDVQLDDRSHNEGLGRVPVGDDDLPDGEPGIATVSLARPLSAYGSFDAVPFATIKGPVVTDTDTDPPTIAKKPCDVLDVIMRGPLSFLDPETQIDSDELAAVQESLDDEEGGSVQLGFAITEQAKFIETLKRIAVQAGLTLSMPGGVVTVARIRAFGADADDETLGLGTVPQWSETEHDPGPSRVVANVPQYAAGDPVRVESVSAEQEAAFARREESLDLWAYNSRLNAQRAARFWHQHLLDRQRAVTCNRYLDGLKHYVADQLGGTLDGVTLPGQVREMMVSLTESPQIGLTLEARRFIWDDVATTLTDDRRCLEPPADIWIPNAPQAFLMQRGQGETLDSYIYPLGDCSCSGEALEIVITGVEPHEMTETGVGVADLADLNGTWRMPIYRSGVNCKLLPVLISGSGEYRNWILWQITPSLLLVAMEGNIAYQPHFGFDGSETYLAIPATACASVWGGLAVPIIATPLLNHSIVGDKWGSFSNPDQITDNTGTRTVRTLQCCPDDAVSSLTNHWQVDVTGYVAGSFFSGVGSDVFRIGVKWGARIETFVTVPGSLDITEWSGRPYRLGDCVGNNMVAVAIGDDGRFYLVFIKSTASVVAVYEADSLPAAVGDDVVLEQAYLNLSHDSGATWPDEVTLTALACEGFTSEVWDE
jgi:hypothetical protein